MPLPKDLKIQRVEGDLAVALSKSYPLHKRGFVKIGDKNWFLPYRYAEEGGKAYNFETRPDDTWIITYPRSENTLLWTKISSSSLGLIIEDDVFANDTPDEQKISKYSVEFVQNQPSPRFIKSHFSLDLLPTVANNDDCKIIYVARNPKNVVVSWFNFQRDIKQIQYQGTFEQLCNDFMNDHTIWSPYWEHVKTAWAIKHKPNILFLFYEDVTKNLVENIKKVAAFFGKTYNDEQIAKLAEHLNIENFRKNPMVNQPAPGQQMKPESFIRQGKTDSGGELFTPELEKKFNEWVLDNLKNTDLVFPN
ncbi:sulfotransferase 1c4 [Lasius niger]|uniref:Sulfotransferase 1c4 n=1 Tax=Lasius niger TaxID=67767 RepID=A0A0J7L448_LASNI|nr:sulfotransferase 1c4 [Lasius niger]